MDGDSEATAGSSSAQNTDKTETDKSGDPDVNEQDPYSSVDAYLAYMARNIDPALAKFRNKDASANQAASDDSEILGENSMSGQGDSAKARKNKNAVPKMSAESETSFKEAETASKDSAAKDDAEKETTEEEKYPGINDCQKEIEEWFEKARQWGIANGFPDVEKLQTETEGHSSR